MVKALVSILSLISVLLWWPALGSAQALDGRSANPEFGTVNIQINSELSVGLSNRRVNLDLPSGERISIPGYVFSRSTPSGTSHSKYIRGWASNVTASPDKKLIYFVVNNEFSEINTEPPNVITNSSVTLKPFNGTLTAYDVDSGRVFEVGLAKPVSDHVFTFDGTRAICLGYSLEYSRFELTLTDLSSGGERRWYLDPAVQFAEELTVLPGDAKLTVTVFNAAQRGQHGYMSQCGSLGCAYGGHHFRVFGQVGQGSGAVLEVPFDEFR